jgi:hypothetical protein
MSLTPGFAADARLQWRALDPESQEIVLDMLDQLASYPPPDGEHIADDVREEHGINHYVFVHLLVERAINSLTVIGVGETTRPIQ